LNCWRKKTNKTIPNLEETLKNLVEKTPTTVAYFAGASLFIDNVFGFSSITVDINSCTDFEDSKVTRLLTNDEKYLYCKLYVEHKTKSHTYYDECLKFILMYEGYNERYCFRIYDIIKVMKSHLFPDFNPQNIIIKKISDGHFCILFQEYDIKKDNYNEEHFKYEFYKIVAEYLPAGIKFEYEIISSD